MSLLQNCLLFLLNYDNGLLILYVYMNSALLSIFGIRARWAKNTYHYVRWNWVLPASLGHIIPRRSPVRWIEAQTWKLPRRQDIFPKPYYAMLARDVTRCKFRAANRTSGSRYRKLAEYNDVTDSSQLTHGMSVRNKNKNTSNFYDPITSPYADLLYLLMRYQHVTYRIMCRCDVAHSLNLTAKKRNTDSTCSWIDSTLWQVCFGARRALYSCGSRSASAAITALIKC